MKILSLYIIEAPTPASFERPATGKNWESTDDNEQVSATPGPSFEPTKEDLSKKDNKEQMENTTSLDKFLAKNTSEDNASFEIIMDNTLQKNKEKHAWLYEKEKEHALLAQQRLALTENKEGDQLKLADRPANLDNWEYTNKNALMYVPECSTLTTEEAVARAKLQEREIKHTNTRLPDDVFKEKASQDSVTKAVESQVLGLKGKIGVDGKEMGANETPNVNGFRFVATPSPAPGSYGNIASKTLFNSCSFFAV
jgi:protein DGCR14